MCRVSARPVFSVEVCYGDAVDYTASSQLDGGMNSHVEIKFCLKGSKTDS